MPQHCAAADRTAPTFLTTGKAKGIIFFYSKKKIAILNDDLFELTMIYFF